MRDKFNLIDHITSFQTVYNNSSGKSISEIIFQGTLQSLLLDFQIISQSYLGQTPKELDTFREYIIQIITNSYNLIRKAKTEDEKKIATFLFESILSVEIVKKIVSSTPKILRMIKS